MSFEDYEIDNEIGRGGFSVVYSARQRSTSRRVALKRYDAALHQEDPQREIRVLRALQTCEFVTQLFDSETSSEPRYLALEYCPSGARELLAQPVRCRTAILGVVLGVARALSALHALGGYHGDVHVSNILLTDSQVVKLADFGAARLPGDSSPGCSVVGRAPEAQQGRFTSAGDVFALGVVWGQLLTGLNIAADAIRQRMTDVDLVTSHRDLLLRMLEDENVRPSADEVIELLDTSS